MRITNNFYFLLLLTLSVSIISCSKAEDNVEDCSQNCYDSYPSAKLKILSKTDSSDLVFGNNEVYSDKSIHAYSFVGTDKVYHSITSLRVTGNTVTESLVLDMFSNPNNKLYVRIGNERVETLEFTHIDIESEDCCVNQRFEEVLHNGEVAFSAANGDASIIIKI